jgi:hypothetical protein
VVVNKDRCLGELNTVEVVNRLAAGAPVEVADEGDAARGISLGVAQELDIPDLAVLRENYKQVTLGQAPMETLDDDIGTVPAACVCERQPV